MDHAIRDQTAAAVAGSWPERKESTPKGERQKKKKKKQGRSLERIAWDPPPQHPSTAMLCYLHLNTIQYL